MNLFTISSNDQSIYYLGQIFGNIGGLLSVDKGPILLSVMFRVLNTAALSVGAMIVVYTTVAGLLSTASEGEFLGKKWSGLWVPVRTVLGIVGLFPSSGGYCAIQVIIMWLILQGIGLADTLWTTVLNLIQSSGGSVYTTAMPFPNISSMVKPPLQNLFTSLVCYESIAYTPGVDDKDSSYSYPCTTGSTDSRCQTLPVFDSSATSYDLGSCGKLVFCDPSTKTAASPKGKNVKTPIAAKATTPEITATRIGGCASDPNSLGCLLCQAQHQALPGIISTLDSVAKKFAQLDYEYQKFYYYSSNETADKVPQWIRDFCLENRKQNRCYVNLPSGDYLHCPPDCPMNYFASYPPYGLINNDKNTTDKGTTSQAALEQIYVPYGIKPYLDGIDFIAAAADQYVGVLSEAYSTFNSLALAPQGGLTGWEHQAEKSGWMLAGTYYYKLTRENAVQRIQISTLPSLAVENLPTVPIDPNSAVAQKRNNISEMPDLFNAINNATNDNHYSGMAGSAQFENISSAANLEDITVAIWSTSSFSGSDPGTVSMGALNRLSQAGWSLISNVQIAFWITLIAVAVGAGISAINFTVIGTGMTSNPLSEVVKAIWGMISPFWMLGLSALFSIGAILGLYVPLIPYMIFTMGAIGWLIATLEAMVAGPIIALGILSPSGQHELLGKSEPAVLIIFNLILRPSLMVFGLMVSLFLANIAVTMINQSFIPIVNELIDSPGVVEKVLLLVGYTSLLVMVLNKVFTVIHVIPEKVLTYIGGQAISYGEGEGLATAKQGLEGAASGISGGAKEAGGAPAGAVTKMGQDEAHKKAQSSQKPTTLAPGGKANENKNNDNEVQG